MDLWVSMRMLDDAELELGEFVAECIWWENNIYRREGNVLLWDKRSKHHMQAIETRKVYVEEYEN